MKLGLADCLGGLFLCLALLVISMRGTDVERGAAILGAVILVVFLLQHGYVDLSNIARLQS